MNLIKKIATEHKRRTENNLKVPGWLQKQAGGIRLIPDDSSRGIQLLIDGLQDEYDYMGELLEKI